MDEKLFQQLPVDIWPRTAGRHGSVFVVIDETVGGDVTMGTIGTTGLGLTVFVMGDTLMVGTAAAELTPRLRISTDPNGMPVRAAPPGVVGDVGVEEETMLLEPEPHIPDIPEVSIVPEVADTPDVADIPDVVAIAGAVVPTAKPPPSKLAVDPNIPDGEVPRVEHVVPLFGIEIVPVTPTGAGLTPGDAISVEPRGIPVWETGEPIPPPSGEVASIVGVGLAIPLTCAMAAALQRSKAGKTTVIKDNLIVILLLTPASRSMSAQEATPWAKALCGISTANDRCPHAATVGR